MGSPRRPAPIGYVEHAAPADLAGVVRCVWTRTYSSPNDDDPGHLVLPDGSADIVFVFSSISTAGGAIADARIIGPMTTPLRVTGRPARFCLGVRLAPAYAGVVLAQPASELVDGRVDYASVIRDAAVDTDLMSIAESTSARVTAAFTLTRRLLARAHAVPRSVRAAIARIVACDGAIRIASLTTELGLTRQCLARQFARHIGLTPKQFSRVTRMQRVLARADAVHALRPVDVNWGRIAHEQGYSDQSHFIADFKSLTGSSPGEWHA
jgi:AraC-like DNA-binding protein